MLANQKDYFNSGETKNITFRIKQLKKLKNIIKINESAIKEALYKDLGKSSFESYAMRVFSIVLLLLVGVVFIKSPADILHNLIPGVSAMTFTIVIIAYYILATILPLDKIIAKIYPIFGFALLFMAIGIGMIEIGRASCRERV